jgi:hypothetical protein
MIIIAILALAAISFLSVFVIFLIIEHRDRKMYDDSIRKHLPGWD